MEPYMVVYKPIQVPIGDYCKAPGVNCAFFNSEDGHPLCYENLGILNYEKDGIVKKTSGCADLKKEETKGGIK